MKYASVCSGVEAATLAWMPLGWEAAWFSEIEPFPCAVLKERFPNVQNLGDMTKIKVERMENGDQKFTGADGTVVVPVGIDLLIGGTPCQDASVAGKRKGLIEGTRSRLAFDFTRIAYESRAKYVVWENVPGCFSLNGGRDFAAFLSSLVGWDVAVPAGGWKSGGIVRNATNENFGLAWRVLDAQYVRVDGFPRAIPQRRRRIILVGCFGDWERAASICFDCEGLSWDTPPKRIKEKGFTADLGSGSPVSGKSFRSSSHGEFVEDKIAGTIKLNSASCGNSSATLTLSIGNGQANSLKTEPELSQTLNAMHDQQVIFCVHGSQDPISNTDHANAVNRNNGLENCVCQYGEVAGTLEARHDSSPCADRGMNVVAAFENHPNDSRVTELKDGVFQQLTARNGTGGGNLPLVLKNAIVRRLMPIECERLMGFPDNWTRIPWRGKPAEHCPDGPRYKACGNSMCVNVMRWIGMRIELSERRLKK